MKVAPKLGNASQQPVTLRSARQWRQDRLSQELSKLVNGGLSAGRVRRRVKMARLLRLAGSAPDDGIHHAGTPARAPREATSAAPPETALTLAVPYRDQQIAVPHDVAADSLVAFNLPVAAVAQPVESRPGPRTTISERLNAFGEVQLVHCLIERERRVEFSVCCNSLLGDEADPRHLQAARRPAA